ncbi:hypothetical protein OEB96_21355 [Paraliomyxa miuraensis]|nr:hypothetical protein [Paraliomyxa miuraensis]
MPLLALVLTACPPHGEHDTGAGTTDLTATSTATVLGGDPSGLDSTGALVDPCADDYDGNHDLASPHPLVLDTTDTAQVTLGDQLLFGSTAEQGQDRLAVCADRPDFFSFEAACASYLVVDLRRIGDGELDLHLHHEGIEVEQVLGTWGGFFLKPVLRPIDPGSYVLEVRHPGNGAPEYAVQVHVLPGSPCP